MKFKKTHDIDGISMSLEGKQVVIGRLSWSSVVGQWSSVVRREN